MHNVRICTYISWHWAGPSLASHMPLMCLIFPPSPTYTAFLAPTVKNHQMFLPPTHQSLWEPFDHAMCPVNI